MTDIIPIPGINGEWYLAQPADDHYLVTCVIDYKNVYFGPASHIEEEAIKLHNKQVEAIISAVNHSLLTRAETLQAEIESLKAGTIRPEYVADLIKDCEEKPIISQRTNK